MDLKHSSVDGHPYVIHSYALPSKNGAPDELSLVAQTVRFTESGPHGMVAIQFNGQTLGDHTFNLDNGQQRVWLVNSVYPKVPRRAVSRDDLKLWLDSFCRNVWGIWSGQLYSEEIAGDLSITPAEYMLEPFLIRDGGTILYGPPGRGKSYLCMAMAVMLRNADMLVGDYKFWAVSKQRPTYINIERSKRSLTARLARVNMALGLAPETPLRFIHARGRSLTDIRSAVHHDIQQHGVDTVFLDSISRAGLGDLNENRVANAIIDMLNSFDVTWVAIGHSPRDSTDHLFGSQMFNAGADLVVRIHSVHEPQQDLGMALEFDKGNDVPPFSPQYLGMQFGAGGLTALYHAGETTFPQLLPATKPATLDDVLPYLGEIGVSTATIIAKTLNLNRSSVARFLSKSPQVVLVRQDGKERFYGRKINPLE